MHTRICPNHRENLSLPDRPPILADLKMKIRSSTPNSHRYVKGVISLFKPRFKVLTYHSVNSLSRDTFEITRETFYRQMQHLATGGYNVISLDDALTCIKRKRISAKSIVITFDDGFKDIYENAFPVLARFGFPATVFLVVDAVGAIDNFSYDVPRKDVKILSWQQIKESMSHGIDYGSHTLTHRNMLELSDGDIGQELEISKNIIQKELGTKSIPFSYPFGLYDEKIKGFVRRAGYTCAVAFGNIISNTGFVDPFELKREKITRATTMDEFKKLVNINYDFTRKIKSIIKK